MNLDRNKHKDLTENTIKAQFNCFVVQKPEQVKDDDDLIICSLHRLSVHKQFSESIFTDSQVTIIKFSCHK